MKRATLRITAAIVTLAVAATAAVAGQRALDRGKKRGPHTFAISCEYSGSFDGNMYVGGHKVVVTRRTAIGDTREGMLEYGSSVVRRPVFVSGVIERGGVMRATLIVVRDSDSSGKHEAGELPADTPR